MPSFDAYIAQRGYVPGLRYAKRVLKLLQWKNPRQRWILKSPDAMRYLPDVFQVFPDLRLVWTHRDPIKAVSSVVSLVGTLFWIRSDKPLSEDAIAQLTNPAGLAGLFNMVIDQVEQGKIPTAQIHNVQYNDFIEDQLGTVETLYQEMGIQLTAPWLSRKARAHRVADPVRFKAWQPTLTVAAGALLGVCVALTSVGAGALGSVFLLFLYPLRMTPHRLVATDIVHAIPLAVLCGLGFFAIPARPPFRPAPGLCDADRVAIVHA